MISCKNCAHQGEMEIEGQGKQTVCRFNPPSVNFIPMMNRITHKPDMMIMSVFPPCPPDEFGCGRWEGFENIDD